MMSQAARRLFDLPAHACHWPIGDAQQESFRWCSAPAMPGNPYCTAHARRALEHGDQPAGIKLVIERTGMAVPTRRSPDSVVDADRYYPSPTTPTRTDAAPMALSGEAAE